MSEVSNDYDNWKCGDYEAAVSESRDGSLWLEVEGPGFSAGGFSAGLTEAEVREKIADSNEPEDLRKLLAAVIDHYKVKGHEPIFAEL